MSIKVAELFAGVGGFRVGLDGYADASMQKPPAGDFETVWANQWEPDGRASKQFAWRCYEKRFGEGACVNEDITKVMDEVEAGERELPDVDMVVGGFPCFVAGTPVLTTEGFIPIENVKVGDYVLTHKGNWKKVITTGSHIADKTIILKGQGSTGIECTPNHPFYSCKKERQWNTTRQAWNSLLVDERFEHADCMVGRMWRNMATVPALPIPPFPTLSSGHKGILDKIQPDANLFYLIGRYLGDGCAYPKDVNKPRQNRRFTIIISCGIHEADQLEQRLMCIPYLHYCKTKCGSTYQFIYDSKQLYLWITDNFKCTSAGKRLPAWVFGMDIEYRRSLFQGYCDADGHIDATSGRQQTTSINQYLTTGMKVLAASMGLASSVVLSSPKRTECVIEGRTVTEHPFYRQSYYTHSRSARFDQAGLGFWGYVRKQLDGHTHIRVYNLEVEDDHSYTVDGIACSNCQPFSIARTLSASNGLTGEKGEKGVLWFEIYRFLQNKHPRYCLFENVDRLLKSPASCRGRDFATILCCLAVEGYTVEWRVVNSAEYGFPQRRKRTFIFAERRDDLSTDDDLLRLLNEGVMADALPHAAIEMDDLHEITLHATPYEENHEFSPGGNGKKSPFGTCGVMAGFRALTCDAEGAYDGEKLTLGDVMTPEEDVPESFYVEGDALDRWRYLKGSKREKRVTKDGHEWWYSEGQMAFPDLLSNPSRTILTSEGGTSPSRMKHIVQVDGRWRRLVPEELERLQGFPAGWTDGCGMTDNQRAFCMGNALVTGVVHRIGKSVARRDAGLL